MYFFCSFVSTFSLALIFLAKAARKMLVKLTARVVAVVLGKQNLPIGFVPSRVQANVTHFPDSVDAFFGVTLNSMSLFRDVVEVKDVKIWKKLVVYLIQFNLLIILIIKPHGDDPNYVI